MLTVTPIPSLPLVFRRIMGDSCNWLKLRPRLPFRACFGILSGRSGFKR